MTAAQLAYLYPADRDLAALAEEERRGDAGVCVTCGGSGYVRHVVGAGWPVIGSRVESRPCECKIQAMVAELREKYDQEDPSGER